MMVIILRIDPECIYSTDNHSPESQDGLIQISEYQLQNHLTRTRTDIPEP